MIKLSAGIIILLFAGYLWVRAHWGRSKNNNTAKKIIEDLLSGRHSVESYEDSLHILICTKPLQDNIDIQAIKQKLITLSGKSFLGKFKIEHISVGSKNNALIIGEAKEKDSIPGYGANQEIDIHFPCWLYISLDSENKKVDFKSIFPESKDHHFLLEDLSVGIYNHFIK